MKIKLRPSLIVLICAIAIMGVVAMWHNYNEVATAAVAGLAGGLSKLVDTND